MVAESRLSALPTEKPKSNVANGPAGDSKKPGSKVKGSSDKKAQEGDLAGDNASYEKLGEFLGASLVGMK